MIDEKRVMIYESLKYFYENKIKVHFKDLNNIFYNGLILSLKKEDIVMIFDERKNGTIPIEVESIQKHTISKFKEASK